MVHELYLTKANARLRAESVANEIGGFVKNETSRVDDCVDFDYKENGISDFAGECPAFQVIGSDGQLIGLYAWNN